MLGSTSHDEQEEEKQEQADTSAPLVTTTIHHQRHRHHLQIISLAPPPDPPPIHLRQLLIKCAELISLPDFSAALRLTFILSSASSPSGDSTQRLVHHFTRSLSLRLHRHSPTANATDYYINAPTASSSNYQYENEDQSIMQSTYLSLNKITPFIRFSHLTANQSILESTQDHRSIHILDFNIMYGVQWPPFMQSISERYPPPTLRISGTGNNLESLTRTGNRLSKFAQSLGLTFQFHPLLNNNNPFSDLILLPNETLAVNCIFYLHTLDRESIHLFLHNIKAINPKIVAVAEIEANHNLPQFFPRFLEALDYYTAVFDSLEATLPPSSRERMAVEEVWFGREITGIVAAMDGENWREQHERLSAWEIMLRNLGFYSVGLSDFALSQAKLLLRLHYPSEGYQIHVENGNFYLGWKNQRLFSVSSWS